MRVLLDLDCTLADFIGGVARLWGLTTADLLRHWPPGEYGMEGPLSRALYEKRSCLADRGYSSRTPNTPAPVVDGGVMTTEQFWRPINDRPGFWLGLDPLPWAEELFTLCLKAAGGEWYGCQANGRHGTDFGSLFVVTAPSRCPGCVREKEDWLLKHFGLPPDRMIPTRHKELMAKSGVLLVDDYERNVGAFRREGGRAVLFPSHHNGLHRWKDDPVRVLRADLSGPV